jgi:peptidoglycan lytic transglycosylase G
MSRKVLVGLGVVVAVSSFAVALVLYLGLVRAAPPRPRPAIVRIGEGEPLREVSRHLEDQGLVWNATLFSWLARWRGLDRRIRSGEYEIPGGQTPVEILDALAYGRRRLFMVTIPEGLTAAEIAQRLEAAELGSAAAFRALAGDPGFARSLGLPGDPTALEGYLFPDTYAFRSDAPPEYTLARMTRRFSEVFGADLQQAARDLGLSVHQAVTLASLIEEEAAVEAERRTISAVFHNRLRRGMPLQSDPTAVYGVDGHRGPVTRADLARSTSHNTYLLPGLPPGPITNPGRASLEAAVHPARGVTALYFVARNDRTHEFSETLAEHNRAIERHRRASPEAEAATPPSPTR